MTNNHVRLFFGWSDAFISLCRHTEEPRHWGGRGGEGGWVQGLSVSSGPSDSFLWAGGGASAVAPVAAAGPGLAAVRRVRHEGAETGAAPGSWPAAAVLAVSSKCLSGKKYVHTIALKVIFSTTKRNTEHHLFL